MVSPFTDIEQTRNLLHQVLAPGLAREALAWLERTIAQLRQNFSEPAFFTAFSTLPRRVGKHDLVLTAAELSLAATLCPGWPLPRWSVDQAARSLLLLSLPQAQGGALGNLLEKLYASADLAEAVALHQTLPLLPDGERYKYWALVGFNSQITAVFNAIALENSYPALHFDLAAWNQLILKAVFVGSPLQPIWGLDERANADLARMLMDYVHERWAAQRDVTPELWRLVAPFIEVAWLPDLEQALRTGNLIQQQAVALASWQAPLALAVTLLAPYPELKLLAQSGQLTWQTIYEKHGATTLPATNGTRRSALPSRAMLTNPELMPQGEV
jgi:hypothetical protein